MSEFTGVDSRSTYDNLLYRLASPMGWTIRLLLIGIAIPLVLATFTGCRDNTDDHGQYAGFNIADLHTVPSDDPKKTSWRASHALALASQLAYEPDDDIKKQAKTWGFADVEPIHAESMAAFVASDDDVLLVAFCGTNGTKDWISNLNAYPSPYQTGHIHKGFHEGFLSLKSKLGKEIERQKKDSQKVWVTGHSLGGALATVFLLEYGDATDLDIAGAITFGQPMVVDEALATEFCLKHYGKLTRFINQDDLVARVPPNFEHVGHLIWFKDDETIEIRPEPIVIKSMNAEPTITKPVVPDALKPLTEKEFEALKRSLSPQSQPPIADDKPTPMGSLVAFGVSWKLKIITSQLFPIK